MKRSVRIRIESKQAEQTHIRQAEGELYAKNGAYYLRYAEPDTDMGRTTATVKWDDAQVKVIRHGDVRSDLTFRSGERTAGSFELPQGRMEMELYTHGIDRRLQNGLGSLSWSYDMYAGGTHVGRIRLRLTIEEEEGE
ncbi:DUF1934 domain-containing protein [Paenibacillus sp. GYB003]|uniref:DUF1934 domain-containing protein n=1 Tax=Paenibacillus sp. GYB003 TaxID=2994392 RepID=UPI002F96BE85